MRKTFLVLLLVAGCDPSKGDPVGLSACRDRCAGEKLSATDRATCRLDCDNSYRETPTPAVNPGVTLAVRCIGDCRAAKPGTDDGAACISACRDSAGNVLPAGVFDTLTSCVTSCQADAALGEDDRATCRLQCAQTASPRPQ